MDFPFELPVEKDFLCIDEGVKLFSLTDAKGFAEFPYTETDQMDEANSKVILLCMGNVEEIGRKLLAKQNLKEAEKK